MFLKEVSYVSYEKRVVLWSCTYFKPSIETSSFQFELMKYVEYIKIFVFESFTIIFFKSKQIRKNE